MEFDADVEHYGKVYAVVIAKKIGIGEMFPGQGNDGLGFVAGFYHSADAELSMKRTRLP